MKAECYGMLTRAAEQDESSGHSMSEVRRAPQDLEPAHAGQVSQEDVKEEEGVSFGLNSFSIVVIHFNLIINNFIPFSHIDIISS